MKRNLYGYTLPLPGDCWSVWFDLDDPRALRVGIYKCDTYEQLTIAIAKLHMLGLGGKLEVHRMSGDTAYYGGGSWFDYTSLRENYAAAKRVLGETTDEQ